MHIWKLPNLTASAKPLVFQAQQSIFYFTLEYSEKRQETVKMRMFILPVFPAQYCERSLPDPIVLNSAAMPWGSLGELESI